ncbi:uncharacterized protein V1518DRAFT_421120 [Limtongia smithiae]|uniref:uncharacterized protein n=1 Tax=Limtongia smithiae TaxID=1125753 RepID=UPI0034CF5035
MLLPPIAERKRTTRIPPHVRSVFDLPSTPITDVDFFLRVFVSLYVVASTGASSSSPLAVRSIVATQSTTKLSSRLFTRSVDVQRKLLYADAQTQVAPLQALPTISVSTTTPTAVPFTTPADAKTTAASADAVSLELDELLASLPAQHDTAPLLLASSNRPPLATLAYIPAPRPNLTRHQRGRSGAPGFTTTFTATSPTTTATSSSSAASTITPTTTTTTTTVGRRGPLVKSASTRLKSSYRKRDKTIEFRTVNFATGPTSVLSSPTTTAAAGARTPPTMAQDSGNSPASTPARTTKGAPDDEEATATADDDDHDDESEDDALILQILSDPIFYSRWTLRSSKFSSASSASSSSSSDAMAVTTWAPTSPFAVMAGYSPRARRPRTDQSLSSVATTNTTISNMSLSPGSPTMPVVSVQPSASSSSTALRSANSGGGRRLDLAFVKQQHGEQPRRGSAAFRKTQPLIAKQRAHSDPADSNNSHLHHYHPQNPTVASPPSSSLAFTYYSSSPDANSSSTASIPDTTNSSTLTQSARHLQAPYGDSPNSPYFLLTSMGPKLVTPGRDEDVYGAAGSPTSPVILQRPPLSSTGSCSSTSPSVSPGSNKKPSANRPMSSGMATLTPTQSQTSVSTTSTTRSKAGTWIMGKLSSRSSRDRRD